MSSPQAPSESDQACGSVRRGALISRARVWLGTPKPRLTPYRIVATLPPLAAVGIGALTSEGLDVPWMLDLCVPWVLPALAGSLLMSAVGAPREKLLSLLTVALCVCVLAGSQRPHEHSNRAEARGPAVTLASVNVLSTNQDFSAFQAWLATSKPDVVAVLEVSPDWARVLEGLAEYPYQKRVVRSDNFGIALLSKFPLDEVEVLRPPAATLVVPSISAVVQSPTGSPFKVIATHPLPPISARAHRALTVQAEFLAKIVAEYPGPAVLMGDFNATPWSSALLLAKQKGLHRVSGLQPTWPVKNKFPALIPIDHILTNSHFTLVQAQVGPNVGSDHLPVLATVRTSLRAPGTHSR